MSSSLEKLPPYLRKYVVEQDYDAYSNEEHATWRYIMRQSRHFFAEHAVASYRDGLSATGITIDRIPRITDMDACLNKFGWGAVGVEGFIPASVFLDLLARGILPIATDMRTLQHVGYTPAPDIVHEAAGHAPIIADAAYRTFLEKYSQLAYRSIISAEDIELYEAIRYLSDIKENPDTKPGEVALAEQRLKQVSSQLKYDSESTKVARLAWWTVEYGLVGSLTNPKIYGAGLLSSISESKSCLAPKVRKIPLTIDCANVTYDITEPQPQLFVVESLDDLPRILGEFEQTLAYKRGGIYGLEELLKAKTINTVALEQGASVSGTLEYFLHDPYGRVEFVKFSGPCQLAHDEIEIKNQGRTQHPEGFSTPLGRWEMAATKSPTKITRTELAQCGLRIGEQCELKLCTGFTISGYLNDALFLGDTLVLLQWNDCTVRRGEKIYFAPDWGTFDQLVGETVQAVYAGPADRMAFGDYNVGRASTSPGRKSPFDNTELSVFKLFEELRTVRQGNLNAPELEKKLARLSQQAVQQHRQHWLLALEIAELAAQKLPTEFSKTSWLINLHENLQTLRKENSAMAEYIDRGLELLNFPD